VASVMLFNFFFSMWVFNSLNIIEDDLANNLTYQDLGSYCICGM
jgi:hypothetical protein